MSDVSCDYADSLLAQLEKAEARVRELGAELMSARAYNTTCVDGMRSRAMEAEARVRELEAENERLRAALKYEQESFVALKRAVEKAEATMVISFGSFLNDWPQSARDALAILRGRAAPQG